MEGVVDVDEVVVDDDEVMEEEDEDAAGAEVDDEEEDVEEEDFGGGNGSSGRSTAASATRRHRRSNNSNEGDETKTMVRHRKRSTLSQIIETTTSGNKRIRYIKRVSPRPTTTTTPQRSSTKTRSVVKLSVTRVLPSYSEPWRKSPQSSSSGTGFLVSNKRIVTNAHVVRRASTVRARASASPVVVSCVVEWISVPLDLAVLKILDEDAFFGTATTTSSAAGAADDDKNGATKKDGKDPSSSSSTTTTTTAKHPPLSLCTDLPRLDENVTCVGFPQGGTQISVTRGVVSRIDVNPLNGVLRIQIDAAINPGNSGGPVFDEHGRVVGVASSHFRGASNIGYIIPGRVVQHFLSMCEDGLEACGEERSVLGDVRCYWGGEEEEEDEDNEKGKEPKIVPGIAHLGIFGSQNLEGKALRKRLGLKDENKSGGVRVVGVKHMEDDDTKNQNDKASTKSSTEAIEDTMTTSASANNNTLLTDDVILTINSSPVGQDGTVILSPTRPDERIHFLSLITKHRIGTVMNLSVLRNAKLQNVNVKLTPNRYIVPKYDGLDAHPSYVVVGGCVFCPLSSPYLQSIAKKKNPSKVALFDRYVSLQQTKDGTKQILLLSKVLADEINVGYHGMGLVVLRSVNGVEVENLRDLVSCLVNLATKNKKNQKKDNEDDKKIDKEEEEEEEEEVVEFRLYPANLETAEYVICLNLKDVLQSERRIMDRHMIASWCSADAIPLEMRSHRNGAKKEGSSREEGENRSGAVTGEYWKTLRMLGEEVERRNKMN